MTSLIERVIEYEIFKSKSETEFNKKSENVKKVLFLKIKK
jgi:hypothetical protein